MSALQNRTDIGLVHVECTAFELSRQVAHVSYCDLNRWNVQQVNKKLHESQLHGKQQKLVVISLRGLRICLWFEYCSVFTNTCTFKEVLTSGLTDMIVP